MTTTKERGERRTVFPSAEIYHVWAHQRASRGRAKGVNVFFEGPTIYSYGHHFPMAKLVVRNGIPVAVMVTTRTYSSTTSQHQGDVRRAVRHLPTFRVEDVTRKGHAAVLAQYKTRIREAAEAVVKSLGNTHWQLGHLNGIVAEANQYAEFFKLKTRFTAPPGFDAGWHHFRAAYETEKARVQQVKRDERRRQQWAQRDAQNAARLEERRRQYKVDAAEYPAKVEAWLSGEGGRYPPVPVDPDAGYQVHTHPPARLRVRGSRIETSLGAVVSVEEATPLLRLVRLPQADGVVSRPEMAVGGYYGVAVNFASKTVSVGCHTIDFAEVERVALQLGL